MTKLQKYMIERDIPGIGGMSTVELCGAARTSNQAITKVGPGVQWQHSYVTGNKTFCIYLADGEESIRKHSELSGIPFTKITAITSVIDPTTANN